MNKKGIVYLIGAGPGDPGLLTIKGRRYLEQAEVVVYDRLSSDALLNYAPADALFIDVGKGPGQQQYSQSEINRLLVQYGAEGKTVVRLKGGDPFLFGRGGEEALALKEAGVSFVIVPGVTAAIAVPAYAGIPVSHRGIAASLTIVTGHEMVEKSEPQINWEAISRASQTLVILMGVANLESIVGRLRSGALTETTPVAIIENGTTTVQRVLVGNLGNIVQVATEADLISPAVIVVGEVVTLATQLEWISEQRPLMGKRIMITRPVEQSLDLAEMIGLAGGDPLVCPTIKVTLGNCPEVSKMMQAVASADWLVFTSQNGVNGFFKQLAETGRDARFLYQVKVAAIGAATGQALLENGIRADLIPEHYTSADLGEKLGPLVKDQRVVLLRVDQAPPELATSLKKYGSMVSEFPVYQVNYETRFGQKIIEGITAKKVDAIIFTSPSTVKGFLEIVQGDLQLLTDIKVICIGPVTADFARKNKIQIATIAVNSSNKDLITALITLFKSESIKSDNIKQ